MRISDWSSDVCSSDLWVDEGLRRSQEAPERRGDPHVEDEGKAGEIPRQPRRPPADLPAIDAVEDDVRHHFAVQRAVHQDGKAFILEILERIEGQPAHRAQLLRSEEHTSELQSLMRISYAVFCLKKKKT